MSRKNPHLTQRKTWALHANYVKVATVEVAADPAKVAYAEVIGILQTAIDDLRSEAVRQPARSFGTVDGRHIEQGEHRKQRLAAAYRAVDEASEGM